MNEEILMSRHEATDNAILTYETVTKVPYKVSEKDTATLVHKEIIMGARLEDEISQFSTIASFSCRYTFLKATAASFLLIYQSIWPDLERLVNLTHSSFIPT